ncbi:MAG: hydroxymethylglutaryl-CoA lyase [Dethiosulfovibrio peptidovorans]|nr:MAG: hydroxymethylglutaryl-CoA lyase [Dethiosulfovibrio peptidovorans]
MFEHGYPERVYIREVCPRDGFQNLPKQLATEDKIALVDAMAETGISTMEVTSFVSPKAIPQMIDAAQVMAHFNSRWNGRIRSVVLVPNLKGAHRALESEPDELNFVISASEAHNQANTRRSVQESLDELAKVAAIRGNVSLELSVATSFECPFDGPVQPKAVRRVIEAALDIGINGITLADTIGTCDPRMLVEILEDVCSCFMETPCTLHLHDTHGMALINAVAAMELGFCRFDTAVGGLGGCPFAPGAAGNLATEDMVNFLHRIGVETGLDLRSVLQVSETMKTMGLPVNSHLSAASSICSRATEEEEGP